MKHNKHPDPKYILRKLLLRHADQLAATHQWLSERERWSELVFAVFASVSQLSEERLRAVVQEMNALDLLTVPGLAEIKRGGLGSEHGHSCLTFMLEAGIPQLVAKRGLTSAAEAAHAIQKTCGGKVQLWLRSHGERMLTDLLKTIRFTRLGKEEAQYALTYWLQNVLAMPLSLRDKNVLQFARQNHFSVNAVVAAADELDLNLALVDDLIHLDQRASKKSAKKPTGGKHGR
jgi:hypothetical protein